MPGSIGVTHDRSSGDFKLCRLVGLSGMVPRGLDGDHAFLGVCTLGGCVVRHYGGVGGCPGEGLASFYSPGMG
jgi:hypothetical protein